MVLPTIAARSAPVGYIREQKLCNGMSKPHSVAAEQRIVSYTVPWQAVMPHASN